MKETNFEIKESSESCSLELELNELNTFKTKQICVISIFVVITHLFREENPKLKYKSCVGWTFNNLVSNFIKSRQKSQTFFTSLTAIPIQKQMENIDW